MPYIKPEDRKSLDADIQLLSASINTVGDLNYAFSRLASIFLLQKGLNYENINAVIGVFGAAQDEFYRRVAGPYETNKILENGDVAEYAEIERRNRSKRVELLRALITKDNFYDKASS